LENSPLCRALILFSLPSSALAGWQPLSPPHSALRKDIAVASKEILVMAAKS